MHNIKLICLDLDGTLLTSKKELSEKNAEALLRAASEGVEIVPATGRFYRAIPETIRNLPYVHYAITINGAQVIDIRNDKTIFSSELSADRSLEILGFLDSLPVIYDCYQDGWGWMSKSMQDSAEQFAANENSLKMLRELRSPVPDLKKYIKDKASGVQKIQAFFRDMALKEQMLTEIQTLFPDTSVTTSIVNNIEINTKDANKGNAMLNLARQTGINAEQTMAFGDDINDVPMIRDAKIGVAMKNASDSAKDAADFITEDCDSDGIAYALNHFLWKD